MTDTDRETLHNAIVRYGHDAQREMAIEECGELIVALCHSRRSRLIDEQAIASEIADVQIMLEQLIIMYNCRDQVADKVRQKIARLQCRLAAST